MTFRRSMIAAAAMTACLAAFLCACGGAPKEEASTEVLSETPSHSVAEVFTMPELPSETTTKKAADAGATKKDAKDAEGGKTTAQKDAKGEKTTAPALPDEKEILQRIDAARAVYGLFGKYRPKLDKNDTIMGENETPYCRVADPKFDTMDKLRKYVSSYFSDEVTESMLSVGLYNESGGKLYAVDAMMEIGTEDTILSRKAEVTDHTADSQDYRVTLTVDTNGDGKADGTQEHNYTYEKRDGKWVFTSFEMF